jgi:hypothetical protein
VTKAGAKKFWSVKPSRAQASPMEVAIAIGTCAAAFAAVVTTIILVLQTEALKSAAKAAALQARIEYFYTQIETHADDPPTVKKLKEQQVHLIYQLDDMLAGMGVGIGKWATGSPHNASLPDWKT